MTISDKEQEKTIVEDNEAVSDIPAEIESDSQEDSNDIEVIIEGEEQKKDDVDDIDSLIDDLPPEKQGLPKKLRLKIREEQKEKLELRKKLQELEQKLQPQPQIQKKEPLNKPKLEDFQYKGEEWNDSFQEDYEQALVTYIEKKKEFEAQELEAKNEQEIAIKTFQEKVKACQKRGRESYKESEMEQAENIFTTSLPQEKIAVVLEHLENPEKIIMTFAKRPELLEKFKKMNLIQFSVEVAKLERNATVITSTRMPVSSPEGRVIEKNKGILDLDEEFKMLKEKADKSRDFTEVLNFKRKNPQYKGR